MTTTAKKFLSLFLILSFLFTVSFVFQKPKIIQSENIPQTAFNNVLEKLKDKPNLFSLNEGNLNVEEGEFNLASSYIVIDQEDGKVLAEKDSGTSLPIASLTKIMTSVVALDLAQKDEKFRISRNASLIQPTKIGVVAGQKMTLEELLNATLLTSANDAAQVIKEGIDAKYKEKVFIKAMNEKAKFLKLNKTSFSNPQGFDNPKNYSSAKDLAVLSRYALSNYPLIAEIAKKDYEFLPKNNNHKQFDLYNWNGLLGVYPGAKGVKIGNTGDAKVTTVVSAKREGKEILVVLLGAPGVLERDLWASQLLDLGFKKASNLSYVGITEEDLLSKYSSWKYWN